MDTSTETIDCACVIHGTTYDWIYVERLYNMLSRHLTPGIRLHVYTEADRPVPSPMIKHVLEDWDISGPRRGWWYKMQMFDSQHHAGPLLYFDLDTVIVNNIDWIWKMPTQYFCAVHDFKRLWRPTHQGLNSSVMWWDTRNWHHIWTKFCHENLHSVVKKYPGDQDYLNQNIDNNNLRFFPQERVQSWRWQCLDGGYDFRKRRYHQPGTETQISSLSSILVFHGNPKPHQITDKTVTNHWQ